MRHLRANLLVMAVLVPALGVGLPGPGRAAETWSMVGNWQITVKGADCAPIRILRIKSADLKRIVGTSHVGEGVGKMSDGSFDGVNFTFTDTFNWEGQKQSVGWTGKLSRNGNAISGSYRRNDDQRLTCKFSGKRMVEGQAPPKGVTSTFAGGG